VVGGFGEKADGMLPGFAAGPGAGGYRMEERTGAGGMAVVFRARGGRLDRQVALKVRAPGLAADEFILGRFPREARAAAAIDDPHVVPVFEAGEAGGAPFIAMRYVRGGDARSLLRRAGRLSRERAAAIVSSVASALDAAHGAGTRATGKKPGRDSASLACDCLRRLPPWLRLSTSLIPPLSRLPSPPKSFGPKSDKPEKVCLVSRSPPAIAVTSVRTTICAG
jgi:hypothetical protein